MARPTLLTPEAHTRIVQYVRGGAYDWVAAQAVGISPRTFYRWMSSGRNRRSLYWQFCQDVAQARAEARVLAEVEVRRDKPFNWLRYGPGRERPGEPGWTESVQVTGQEGGPVEQRVTHEYGDEQFADILRVLAEAGAFSPRTEDSGETETD